MKKYEGNLVFESENWLGKVEVIDNGSLRSLHFGTPVMQSSMFLHDPFVVEMEYNRVMLLALLFDPSPRQVLFLGLGGGSKQKFLWKHFPECYIEAVEYNPLVIDVCQRFFHVPSNDRLKLHEEDALQYIQKPSSCSWDLIFVDLYVGSGMSPAVTEHDFFSACFERLKWGGVLVWNVWRSSSTEMIEASVGNLARSFGKHILILPVQESLNYVILAFKPPLPTLEHVMEQAEKLTAETGMDFVKTLQDVNMFKGHGYF